MNPQLLKLAFKLIGGPTRSNPAGIKQTIQFLQQIVYKSGAPKYKKDLAKQLIKTLQTGQPLKYPQGTGKLVKNIQANTKGKTPVAPGVELRQELMINPYEQSAGQGYYLHMNKTPMIDVDLPIGPASHMAQQMTHGLRNRSDFMKRLHKFLYSDKGKTSKFRLYDTQGGQRLFDISRRTSPKQYVDEGTL